MMRRARLLACLCLLPSFALAGEEEDLRAARDLFERNIAAIQDRDREAYLACYRDDERLVRVGPDGFQLGYREMADGAPATGSDDWPEALVANDLRLAWLGEGLVYGTYRYRVVFDGVATDGISGRLFQRREEGWRIAVTSAFGAAPGVAPPPLALVGATLYDGRGGEPVPGSVVLVRGGRVEAVGTVGELAVPDGVDRVELAGRFLVPGLVDTHVHYSQTGWVDGRPDAADMTSEMPYAEAMADCRAHPERFHRAFLHSGVTAVFDVGGYPWTRDLAAACEDDVDAPHVAATGPLLATWVPEELWLAGESQFVLIDDAEAARRAVRSHVALGSAAIKIWFIARDEHEVEDHAPAVRAAIEEARLLGLSVVVHATKQEAARVAVQAGANLLVHSVDDEPVDDAFVRVALSRGVYYCPTLTVMDGYRHLAFGELTDELRGQLEAVDPSVKRRVLLTESLGNPNLASEEARDRYVAWAQRRRRTMDENLATLHAAGVPVVLGTDAGNPLTLHGPSVFPELEAMAAAGMTPGEVLVAATSRAAEAMGRGEDLGVVEAGRVADLLVLTEDPGAGVEALRSITHVCRGGLLHRRSHLAPAPE